MPVPSSKLSGGIPAEVVIIGSDGTAISNSNRLSVNADCGVSASANFTPAAGSYGAADIIDAAKEMAWTDRNGVAVPAGSLIHILTTILKIDVTSVPSGQTSYSLALYSVTPPSAQADNDAWTLASGDLPSYLGTVSLGTPVDLGAACFVKNMPYDPVTGVSGFDVKLTGSSVFARLITAGAHTATAVARQVILRGMVV